jgi:two-component system sensor histidine kinase ChiS
MFDFKKASDIQEVKDNTPEPEQGAPKDILLMVDDEPANLVGLRKILDKDYQLIEAHNAQEALQLIETPGIKVILSDQKMPGMSGIEFFIETERRQHRATRLILTGFADIQSVMDGINQAKIYAYLTKPIDGNELRFRIKQALDHFNLQNNNLRLLSAIKTVIEENSELKKRLEKYEPITTTHNAEIAGLSQPTKLRLGILFADIRGFTQFTSKEEALKVIDLLQKVFKSIHEIIYEDGGVVDKHMGDGLMAVYGLGDMSLPKNGILSLKKIVKAYPSIIRSIDPSLEKSLKLGVGFAMGEVVVGMLGTERRSEIAVIGEPANLSSRLQELTKLPLRFDDAREIFGTYDYSMGIVDISSSSLEDKDFETVILSEKCKIRSFPEIEKVAVIKS